MKDVYIALGINREKRQFVVLAVNDCEQHIRANAADRAGQCGAEFEIFNLMRCDWRDRLNVWLADHGVFGAESAVLRRQLSALLLEKIAKSLNK